MLKESSQSIFNSVCPWRSIQYNAVSGVEQHLAALEGFGAGLGLSALDTPLFVTI